VRHIKSSILQAESACLEVDQEHWSALMEVQRLGHFRGLDMWMAYAATFVGELVVCAPEHDLSSDKRKEFLAPWREWEAKNKNNPFAAPPPPMQRRMKKKGPILSCLEGCRKGNATVSDLTAGPWINEREALQLQEVLDQEYAGEVENKWSVEVLHLLTSKLEAEEQAGTYRGDPRLARIHIK
jgi:hypothetical protein